MIKLKDYLKKRASFIGIHAIVIGALMIILPFKWTEWHEIYELDLNIIVALGTLLCSAGIYVEITCWILEREKAAMFTKEN